MRKTSTVTMCLHVCLTSTTTDTAALTKMMSNSFILHSNGTQTICRERDSNVDNQCGDIKNSHVTITKTPL